MLTIGEVASRARLRASGVRYYEAQGLIATAQRKGGKRIYDASVLDRLAVIELAKRAGFSLQEIRELITDVGRRAPPSIWRKLAKSKRADLDQQIAMLISMKEILSRLTRCTCATLADCGRAFNAARSPQPPGPPLAPTAGRRSS